MSEDGTNHALRCIRGGVTCNKVYADKASDAATSCNTLNIPVEYAQQGHPESNGLIERASSDIITGARVLLAQAGLPDYLGVVVRAIFCLMEM